METVALVSDVSMLVPAAMLMALTLAAVLPFKNVHNAFSSWRACAQAFGRAIGVVACLCIAASLAQAQGVHLPVCGDSCTPSDPNQNAPNVQVPIDRGLPSNQRGTGNIFSAAVPTGGATTIQGSSSFTYKVPMYSLPGRAGMDLNLALYYNSHIWINDATGGMLMGFERDVPGPGFQLNFGFLEWNPSANGPSGILTTADGTKHTLSSNISNLVPNAPPPNNLFYSCANQICLYDSDDSSYINVSRPLGTFDGSTCTGPNNCPAKDSTVTYKNGTKAVYQSFAVVTNDTLDEFVMRPYLIEDSNGNLITITYTNINELSISSVTDSVGRTVRFFYNDSSSGAICGGGGACTQGSLLNCITDGASCSTPGAKTYKFSWDATHAVNFNFTTTATELFAGTLQTVTSGFHVPVLTRVTRPDQTSVQFNYGDWGIVNDVKELSADGITARYELSYNFPAQSAGALSANPTFTQQTETVNGQTNQWQFAANLDATGLLASSSITDPAGQVTTTTYSTNHDWQDGLPIQVQISPIAFHTEQLCIPTPCTPPTPAPLKTTNITWTSDLSEAQSGITNGGTQTGKNPRPASTVTILDDNSQSKVTMQYDNSPTPIAAGAPQPFTGSGSITDKQETDFRAGAPGPVIRETVTAYTSLGNHILGLPTDVKVKDGSGKVVSHTVMSYDGAAVRNESPLPVSHDNTNYAATSTTPRGNLTSSTSYADPVGNTGGVTTTYTYDMTGNKVQQQSGCCSTMAWNYSSTTQFAYPDSVVVGPTGSQLTTSYTYFLNLGMTASVTDWNGKVTNYSYDVNGRSTSVQGPDGVTISASYDDFSANPGTTNSTTANSLVSKHIFDFKGRTIADETLNGTALVSTVSSINDAKGRATQISNPYGPGETPVYTAYSYDLLDRPVQVIPPAVGSVAQTPYLNSFSGSVHTSTDPAGQTSMHYSNALGQIVRVDQPGLSGAAAATASLTITGTEQSVPSSAGANGATAGTATATINGSERSTSVLTHAATQASVTVTLGGANSTNVNSVTICTGGPPSRLPLTCHTNTTHIADSGSLAFTVHVGTSTIGPISVPYSASSSLVTLAAGLFSQFPANSLVTMSNPNGGASFNLTTIAAGSSNNTATITTTRTSSCVNSDTLFCVGVGWTMTLSGPGLPPTTASSANFTGGTDNGFTTHFDTGTVTLAFTANGTAYSKQSTYGQNSSANSVAQDLYNQFNGDATVTQVVRLTPPGTSGIALNAIGFTTVADGAGTNYPISAASVTTDTADYAAGTTSFPASLSGLTFTPGVNGTLFDSGTILLKVNGINGGSAPSKQITYGQGSNAQGAAAQLASLVHSDSSFPVDASVAAGTATIAFTSRAQGSDANAYSITITGTSTLSSSFPTASFAAPAESAAMAGGSNGSPSFDPSVVLTTTYSYDPYGHLLQSVSGQQTRTYVYDGLGRMTSSATPESAGLAVKYAYTDFGALAQKIDPRTVAGTSTPITTSFTYDALNRVKTITYNDNVTPNVTYTYNAPNSANNTGGRLASVANGAETKSYQYDVMGRITQCLETIGTNSYTVNYAYGADGQISSITYPSQLKVNYGYDPIGRFKQLGTATQSILTINPTDYTAAGLPLTATYGNNIKASFTYNNQLQQTLIQYAGPSPATPLLSLAYSYGTGNNNGQIQSITDNVVSARSTSYVYDALGRLQSAQTLDQTSPNTWRLDYSYDRYGNRISQAPAGGAGSMPASFTPVDPATNRIQGLGAIYDAVGNMVSDGLNNFQFDANNKLVATSGIPGFGGAPGTFTYGPGGNMVSRNGTVFIYAEGRVIAEYANGAAATSPTAEYINLGSQQIARVASGVLVFNYRDHLSIRVNADASGNPIRTYGHFPYGETAYETGTPNDFKFTSYRRDPNTGLDDADARFYSSRLGRFMSMDPVLGDDRYAYVSNDPINLVDPTGRMACTTNPFDPRPLPLCGPDQLGGGGGNAGASCGVNFDEGGFTVSFASGCNSFSVNFDGGMAGPFGDVQSSLQDLLAMIIPIDTCPGGTFECPDDGKPLFGTPQCDPRWCAQDLETLRGKCDESNEGKFGPCAPPPSSKPFNWAEFFMKLSCWAGQDPDNMAPINRKPEPKDSSDAPEKGTPAGRKRLPGQHAPGGRGPGDLNDRIGYAANVMECLQNVDEVLEQQQGEKK